MRTQEMNVAVRTESACLHTIMASTATGVGRPSMTTRRTALCPISSCCVCLKRAPLIEISHTETTFGPICAANGGATRNRSFVRRLRAAASYISFFGRTDSTYSTKQVAVVIWLTHGEV